MSICKAGCRGSCRCTNQHELCLVVGEENIVKVPCPHGESGCGLDILDSSTLVFTCPCCGAVVRTFIDPLDINQCDGCELTLDLTIYDDLINMRHSPCKLSYVLRITSTSGTVDQIDNKVFLRGSVCLDFTDIIL